MTRRFLILCFAVGLLALGGLNAQAGQISLPATLDNFVPPPATNNAPPPGGNYAIVGGNLEFSEFTYSATSSAGGTPPPAPSGVTVAAFTSVPGETGIVFSGGFHAPVNTMVDYSITFQVTALSGSITDAYLLVNGGSSGNGTFLVTEAITNAANGAALMPPASLNASDSGVPVVSSWSGVTSISVTKDIFLDGGTTGTGSTVSIVEQGFSSIPEPASMALLGIGLSGLFTLRRFLKRTSVA
jgi:hypothetical protein